MLEKILIFLETKGDTPSVYGVYHICCILACILLTALLIVFFKNAKDDTFRRIALIIWIIMVVFEVYKEVCFVGSSVKDGKVKWDYSWYAFPYQLCSTPLYLMPFVFLLKDCKLRDAVIAFLGTFSVFGGLVNYIYPEQVFVSQIGISIQTMVHHGLQLVFGIYALVYVRKKLNFKFFLSSIIVFICVLIVAVLLNEIFYYSFIKDLGETFNMFFISPHFDCTLPILSIIYPKVPYFAFFLIYTLGFIICAFIMYVIPYGIIKVIEKKSK